MPALLDLLRTDPIPLGEVAAYLDGLPQPERISAAVSVPGALQAKLFEAAAASAPVTIADIVPPEKGPLATVRHHGRNSLPLFTRFEKRFCRPEGGKPEGKLFGYNHQTMRWLTGPGSYVAYDGPKGEVVVDYREMPGRVPADWPAPQAHDQGRSKLVWKDLVDHLRRVSKHVTIGRAFRGEAPQKNWFILCREE